MKSIGKIRNTESLTDKAYSHIKTALNRGAFNPGQRLTSREVAAALGVSITPAREALGRLCQVVMSRRDQDSRPVQAAISAA